jgi:DNA recombination protein RmuC
MSTSNLIFVCIACLVFLAVGVWIGRLLSKGALSASENRSKTEFEVFKQQQQQESQTQRQELALLKQENQQLNLTMASDKHSTQEIRIQLESLRTNYAEVSTKLSASLSNESGLNTRLSERNTQIDTLNLQLQALNQSQAGYQELIENQKVQLGQAQEQKLQLDQLRQEQLKKDQDLLLMSQQITSAHSHIAELEMANRKDESLINERNLQIDMLNQKLQTLNQSQAGYQELIENQKVQLGQAQEQKLQLDQLRQEQLKKDQDLFSTNQQITNAHSRIAELEMANRKDESLINERNLQITELQQANAELLGRLEQSHQTIKTQNSQIGQAQAEKEQLAQLQLSINSKDKYINELQSELSANHGKIQELKTASLKDAESMTEKLSLLENNKVQLKQEFENLAHQIFENKQQHFSQQSQQGLNTLLNPFKEQLESFRKRVDEVHTNTVEGQTSMKAELEKLRELNVRINDEAANLTKALKGDKKLQGTWGEQKVDLLLQRAGLRKDFEYKKEVTFKNDEGQNQRPDFVVQLPEGKHIIIDSKMSLIAYTQYVAAETDQERKIALNAHIKALKDHITELGQRKYHTLNGLDSPDFVFLFMGVEPAYILAAEHAPWLFEEAYEKNIAIVTATNLLPVLRVVANLWVIQRQNQTTKELADQASRVYDKLRIFVEKMEDLGKHIDKAQVSYRESFNTLKDGQGSLTKTVSKFVDLGVKVSKQLPPSVLLEDLDSQPSLSINVKE